MSLLDLLILILLISWLGGWGLGLGSFIHVLFVLLIIVVFIRLIRGNTPI